jgi:hypothetical protein
MRAVCLAFAVLVALASSAPAQTSYPDSNSASQSVGTVILKCLNNQAQAVPCTAASPTHYLSAASTNATSVKNAAAALYAISAVNTNAATAYLKFYDKATAPTCNSDTVVMTVALVQNVPVNLSPQIGVAFANGIGFCITAAAADNDNTAATTGITLSLATK